MTLGKQSARRIGHHPAAVGVLTVPDKLFSTALGRQPERFVGDEFVGGETVVQFAHLHILGPEAGLFVNSVGGVLRHVVADQFAHGVRFQRTWKIRRHGLALDRDRVV